MPLMASVGEEPTYSGWTEQSQVSFLLSLGRGAKAPRFKFFQKIFKNLLTFGGPGGILKPS